MQIHLGFITSNAGYDIPGSTIRWTIETFYDYFASIIVIDGNLKKEGENFYSACRNLWIGNLEVHDEPWTGKHLDQYWKRLESIPVGDWMLMLDCDEAPTIELAENIKKICEWGDTHGVSIMSPPAINMWCKHNSSKFYKTSWFDPNKPPDGHKNILVKRLPTTRFITNKTGTHVTPYQTEGTRTILPYGHYHFKSPETTIFNSAICIMDDLYPNGEQAHGGIRGFTEKEVSDLYTIGTKYDLLSKEKFRKATKSKSWPDELVQYVKRFKYRPGHCRMLYTLYYVLLQAAQDTDPLTYEDACEIGTLNQNYKLSESKDSPMLVPHTPVFLPDSDSVCGAG